MGRVRSALRGAFGGAPFSHVVVRCLSRAELLESQGATGNAREES